MSSNLFVLFLALIGPPGGAVRILFGRPQLVGHSTNFLAYQQPSRYLLVAVGSSGILKAKQKLGVTFNFDKQDGIDFTKFS